MKCRLLIVLVMIWLSMVLAAGKLCAQFPALDSLRGEISRENDPARRLTQILEFLRYRNSLRGDTLIAYAKQGAILAQRVKNRDAEAWCNYYAVAGLLAQGKTETVIPQLEADVLLASLMRQDRPLYFKVQLLKANALNRMDRRAEALELQLRTLKQAREEGALPEQMYLYNYIGATYLGLNRGKDAYSGWHTGLGLAKVYPELDTKEITQVIGSNLALWFRNQITTTSDKVVVDSFLYYVNQTIDGSRDNQLYWLLPTLLGYRASFYGVYGDTARAYADFREAIAYRRKLSDPLYLCNDMVNLAYVQMGVKQFDSALNTLQEVMQIAGNARLAEVNRQVFYLLAAIYKEKGESQAYAQALERLFIHTDSTSRLNATERVAEVEARYALQEKEATIKRQQLELLNRKLIIFAIGGLLLAVLLAALFVYRDFRKKQGLRQAEERLREEKAVRDAEERERKRIAADLHDNLGVQANAMLHQASLIRQSPEREEVGLRLQEAARDMLRQLRETVWALKQADVELLHLWIRMVNFIHQTATQYPSIDFACNGEPQSGFSLPAAKALHLSMMVQEAVQNATRHSGSSQITIDSRVEPHLWTITVSDNGKGFDPDALIGPEHYGLEHMKARALDAGFSLTLRPTTKGTSVEIQVPLQAS